MNNSMKKRIVWFFICNLMLFIPLNGNGQNSDAERGIRLYEQKSYTSALPYLQRAAKAGNIEVLPYLT